MTWQTCPSLNRCRYLRGPNLTNSFFFKSLSVLWFPFSSYILFFSTWLPISHRQLINLFSFYSLYIMSKIFFNKFIVDKRIDSIKTNNCYITLYQRYSVINLVFIFCKLIFILLDDRKRFFLISIVWKLSGMCRGEGYYKKFVQRD